MHDLVIIGGGPAGCMAAIGAKQANPNADVVLVDPEDGGRYRIGEAMLTGTVMTFEQAGIAEEIARAGFHRKDGATYVWGETRTPWYVDYPSQSDGYPSAFIHDGRRVAIHAPRHRFDALLRDIARNRGVEIIDKRLESAQTTSTNDVRSIALSGGQTLRARHYIDATGQSAALAKRVTQRDRIWAPRVARYTHIEGIDWEKARTAGFSEHRTNIISHPEGWFWVIHLGEAGGGLTSVGFVLPPEKARDLDPKTIDAHFPALADFGLDDGRFAKAMRDPIGLEPVDRFVGHPDWSYRSASLHGANWSLAGDAALFLDPILSQGVTLAVHYGYLRGREAILGLADGRMAERMGAVSHHYLCESAVLEKVVGQWYESNASVMGWRQSALDLSAPESNDPIEAFRAVTNLENLFDEYHPFPSSVRESIDQKLGVAV